MNVPAAPPVAPPSSFGIAAPSGTSNYNNYNSGSGSAIGSSSSGAISRGDSGGGRFGRLASFGMGMMAGGSAGGQPSNPSPSGGYPNAGAPKAYSTSGGGDANMGGYGRHKY